MKPLLLIGTTTRHPPSAKGHPLVACGAHGVRGARDSNSGAKDAGQGGESAAMDWPAGVEEREVVDWRSTDWSDAGLDL